MEKSLNIEPLDGDFVATVSGIDLREPLGAEARRSIEAAADAYGVLVFRDQALSQGELVEFAQGFGDLDRSLHQLMKQTQARLDHQELSDISNVAVSGGVADRGHRQALMNIGNSFWHSDGSFMRRPYRYTILRAVSVVSWGGETEYADLRAAYDSLDARTKSLVADKVGVFDAFHYRIALGLEYSDAEVNLYPPVSWPLVRTHPGSGRKLLFVGQPVRDILGMPVAEGRALAHELLEHATQRQHVYCHSWLPGDVVMSDNRHTLHRGRRFDLGERREMWRAGVLDDVETQIVSPELALA